MIFIGIDPGASGGFAVLDARGEVMSVGKMPDTERELLDALRPYNPSVFQVHGGVRAALERVWSSPQMGVKGAFTFGHSVGACKMALAASCVPFDEVLPQHWQKALGVTMPKRAKGSSTERLVDNARRVEMKNKHKLRAQQLFPDVTITHAIADALLIAEFCRRQHSGAASTARPASRGLFDGEKEDTEEARCEETKGDSIARQIDEAGFGSAKAATGRAAGDGAAEDRPHRERRTRLRRRSR